MNGKDRWIERMRELQKAHWHFVRVPWGKTTRQAAKETGYISLDEMGLILTFAQQQRMPMTMGPVGFGFGRIAVAIYNNESYPGVDNDHLITLSQDHLDPELNPWVAKATLGSVQDEAWSFFSRFTHSEANKNRLILAQIPPPRSRASFNY